MQRSGPCAFLAAAALACGPVHSQIRPEPEAIRNLRTLAVVFPDAGEFTIYAERAEATEAPGLLFGLVGAAVASAVNASRDAGAAESLATFLEAAECRSGIRSALEETLDRIGRLQVEVFESSPDQESRRRHDGVLELDIDTCGFRMIDQERGDLAAFVEISAQLVLSDGRKVWDDRESVVGAGRSPLSRLQASPDLVRDEFAGVLQEAGRRIANDLLYP